LGRIYRYTGRFFERSVSHLATGDRLNDHISIPARGKGFSFLLSEVLLSRDNGSFLEDTGAGV
jgi:hypothetical protein